ncbi:MAG: hypothetical protein HQM04_12450 [Magnetococcales bacterium]|nr:hypothetical protein [Magnetococcales bacterium]MBF0115835.1 hypothetical protein [Magnetococcales bacterium]
MHALDFKHAYRVEMLSIGDNIGLLSGVQSPTGIDTTDIPVGSLFFQTDGTLWKRKGEGATDWVRLVAEDSALFTGAVSSITSSNLSPECAVVSDAAGKVAASAVTASELGHLAGVTSSIQNQLNGKATREILQNIRSANYTLALSDAGKHILHPFADNSARTFTIPANSSVPFPIGTTLWFVNERNTVTISITTDTLMLSPSGATGNRTLAARGMATALKITATKWMISGFGLS